MQGFCSYLRTDGHRGAVVATLGIAYALLRVWYTVAINMSGLTVPSEVGFAAVAMVATWSRIGIDLAVALFAPRIKTLWNRRWVGAVGAALLVGATVLLFCAGSFGAFSGAVAIACAVCYGVGSDLLYLTWSEAFVAYDDRSLNAFMLYKTGLDALLAPLVFAPRVVVLVACMAMPALSAVGLGCARVAAPLYGARPQRRWHGIPPRTALVLAAGVVVLFFSFSFSQSAFMTSNAVAAGAAFVIAGRWLAFGLMAVGVRLSRDFRFEMFYRLAIMAAIVGFLVRMLELPGSYAIYLVAAIASTRVAEDATVMVLVSVSRYSTAAPLSVLAWGRVCFRLGPWVAVTLVEALLGSLIHVPSETVLDIACAVEIVLLAFAGMWLLREQNLNAFLWGRGAADATPAPDGASATSASPAGETVLVIAPRCRYLAATYGLTERETDVLALLVDGRSVPYVQETLHVSANTAKTHIRHIYQKLGVHNRQDLITLAQGAPV